jgi:hypothetical protein
MGAQHRENARAVLAEIARASGLTFKHPDRMTRSEAEAVIRWAQSSPEFMAAYSNRSHPYHKEAVSYSQWPFFFKDFPQTEAGEPVDWAAVQTAEDAAAPAADDFDPFARFSPEEARARIEAAFTDEKYKDFRAAYADRNHPDHALAVKEIARLHEIEAGTGPGIASAASAGAVADPAGLAAPSGSPAPGAAHGSPRPGLPTDRAGALRELDARYADKAFMARMQSRDRQERAAANAEIEPLFRMAYPEHAPTEGAAAQGGP